MMKNAMMFFVMLVMVVGCKTASTPVTSTKLDKSSQVTIKGDWVITNVSYPGSNYIEVSSFNIADSKCFVGSTWNFISNNNKGNMSLTKSGCPAFSSPIVWSINKEGMFVLKIVEAGVKSKTVTQGYLLKVANQTENSFQLIDNITVGGQKKEVTYQFEKIISTKN